MFGWLILLIVVGFVVYVRLAPHDANRWHRAASGTELGETASQNGFVWRVAAEGDGTEMLRKLDAIAAQTPRTQKLAGSVEEGRVTYVTRSQVLGFPDYNTIGIYEDAAGTRYVEIFSRLRFGRSDLGVNRKRVKGWLAAL